MKSSGRVVDIKQAAAEAPDQPTSDSANKPAAIPASSAEKPAFMLTTKTSGRSLDIKQLIEKNRQAAAEAETLAAEETQAETARRMPWADFTEEHVEETSQGRHEEVTGNHTEEYMAWPDYAEEHVEETSQGRHEEVSGNHTEEYTQPEERLEIPQDDATYDEITTHANQPEEHVETPQADAIYDEIATHDNAGDATFNEVAHWMWYGELFRLPPADPQWGGFADPQASKIRLEALLKEATRVRQKYHSYVSHDNDLERALTYEEGRKIHNEWMHDVWDWMIPACLEKYERLLKEDREWKGGADSEDTPKQQAHRLMKSRFNTKIKGLVCHKSILLAIVRQPRSKNATGIYTFLRTLAEIKKTDGYLELRKISQAKTLAQCRLKEDRDKAFLALRRAQDKRAPKDWDVINTLRNDWQLAVARYQNSRNGGGTALAVLHQKSRYLHAEHDDDAPKQSPPWHDHSTPWSRHWLYNSTPWHGWRDHSTPWHEHSTPWHDHSTPWHEHGTPWG